MPSWIRPAAFLAYRWPRGALLVSRIAPGASLVPRDQSTPTIAAFNYSVLVSFQIAFGFAPGFVAGGLDAALTKRHR